MPFLIVIKIMKIQYGAKTKIHQIAYSYYRRKPSEPFVLNVEMQIQTLLSIGMKYFNYMTKSLFKIAFFSVNLLILIFRQISITGLPFPQTFISMRHPVI